MKDLNKNVKELEARIESIEKDLEKFRNLTGILLKGIDSFEEHMSLMDELNKKKAA